MSARVADTLRRAARADRPAASGHRFTAELGARTIAPSVIDAAFEDDAGEIGR